MAGYNNELSSGPGHGLYRKISGPVMDYHRMTQAMECIIVNSGSDYGLYHNDFLLVNSLLPSPAISRPIPDFFTPPKGSCGRE